MKLAETGHLTMGTLHTVSASQTVTRIIDAFPAHQQAQIRTQLSLGARRDRPSGPDPESERTGPGGCARDLVATPGIRNMIRDDKVHQIYGAMQAGQESSAWMQTMNQALARLVEQRLITRELAAVHLVAIAMSCSAFSSAESPPPCQPGCGRM